MVLPDMFKEESCDTCQIYHCYCGDCMDAFGQAVHYDQDGIVAF